jgi:hypothetical protein
MKKKKELREIIELVLMDLTITEELLEEITDEITDDVGCFIEKNYTFK